MVCESCSTEVPSSFEYAVANNVCPKCGSNIMSDDKMEAFRHLRKDLSTIQLTMDPVETIDRIVMHLVANYKIRPRSIPEPEIEVNEEDVREQIYKEEMAKRESDGIAIDDDLPEDLAEKVEKLKGKTKQGRKFTKKGNPVVNRIG